VTSAWPTCSSTYQQLTFEKEALHLQLLIQTQLLEQLQHKEI
jgi:hypothetical protein